MTGRRVNTTDPDLRPAWRSSYAGSTTSLNAARNDVAELLQRENVDHESIERAKLVVGELTSNAVRAAPGRRYRLEAELLDETTLVVAVRNVAKGSSIPPRDQWRAVEHLAPQGRGLAIVDAIADSVTVVEPADGLVEVSARLGIDRG